MRYGGGRAPQCGRGLLRELHLRELLCKLAEDENRQKLPPHQTIPVYTKPLPLPKCDHRVPKFMIFSRQKVKPEAEMVTTKLRHDGAVGVISQIS